MAAPKIASLLPNYPALITPAALAELVGGPIGESIKKFDWETCCIRISRALNYAGHPVQGFGNIANPAMSDGKVRAQQGADKKWYIFSTYDLKAYLSVKYGQPKSFPGSATADDVKGNPGIIMFGWRHVDLWDGEKVARLSLFASGNVLKDGLYLWPEQK
jgi:hypothetical protein